MWLNEVVIIAKPYFLRATAIKLLPTGSDRPLCIQVDSKPVNLFKIALTVFLDEVCSRLAESTLGASRSPIRLGSVRKAKTGRTRKVKK
jgi:hypothetical protein